MPAAAQQQQQQQRGVLDGQAAPQQQQQQQQQRPANERTRLLAEAAPAGDSNSSIASSHSTSSSRRAFDTASASSTAAAAAAAAAADGATLSAADRRRLAADKEAASWMRLTLLLCLLFVSAGLATYLDAQQLELLIESLRGAPLASMMVFTVLFAAAVVLLVPGMLLSIGSGAAFGLVAGSVVAWLGTVLGQVAAFVLGRYLLRDVVVAYLEKRVHHFKAMDAGISGDGWKLVLLLRLSPVLPYNLMNYFLGITAIRLVPYTVASAVAAIPYVCLFAYLGSVSTDLYRLLHDGARAYLSPQLLIVLACCLILSAVGLFFVCRHAVVDGPAVDDDDDEEEESSHLTAIEEGGGVNRV